MEERTRADAVRQRANELRERSASISRMDGGTGDAMTIAVARQLVTAVDQIEALYDEWATREISLEKDDTAMENLQAALWSYELIVRSGMRRIDELTQQSRAQKLTEVLANASILEGDLIARDVGSYKALEFIPRSAGVYWTSADLVDNTGSGYLQITVARSSERKPVTIGGTVSGAAKRTQASTLEGIVVHTSARSSADETAQVSEYRVVAIRPNGSYVDIQCVNQDSTSRSITREDPPVNLDRLVEIATQPELVP